MPVLAAVAHLAPDASGRAALLAHLSSLPGLSLGTAQGDRLPLVLCTDDRQADRQLWTALQDSPGLLHLELVSADFSDLVLTEGELP